jgi:hypothetical protein
MDAPSGWNANVTMRGAKRTRALALDLGSLGPALGPTRSGRGECERGRNDPFHGLGERPRSLPGGVRGGALRSWRAGSELGLGVASPSVRAKLPGRVRCGEGRNDPLCGLSGAGLAALSERVWAEPTVCAGAREVAKAEEGRCGHVVVGVSSRLCAWVRECADIEGAFYVGGQQCGRPLSADTCPPGCRSEES